MPNNLTLWGHYITYTLNFTLSEEDIIMLTSLVYIIAIIAFVLYGIHIEYEGAGRISLDYAFFAVVISTVFVLLVLSSIKSKLNDISISIRAVSSDIDHLSDDVKEVLQGIQLRTDDIVTIRYQTYYGIETISRKVDRLSADVHEIKKSVGHQTDDDDDGYDDDDDDDDDEHANI